MDANEESVAGRASPAYPSEHTAHSDDPSQDIKKDDSERQVLSDSAQGSVDAADSVVGTRGRGLLSAAGERPDLAHLSKNQRRKVLIREARLAERKEKRKGEKMRRQASRKRKVEAGAIDE